MIKFVLLANVIILCAAGVCGIFAVLSKSLASALRPMGYVGIAWVLFGLARVAYAIAMSHHIPKTSILMTVVSMACLGGTSAMLLSPKGNSKWLQILMACACLALTVFAWSVARRFI